MKLNRIGVDGLLGNNLRVYKIPKSDYYLLNVYLYICLRGTALPWSNFYILIFEFFLKSLEKMKDSTKSGKNNR
jgi:hypothetical protein